MQAKFDLNSTRSTCCCFTGHRKISSEQTPVILGKLTALLRQLIFSGVRDFLAGGALGFDTMAAETVLALTKEYPQIRLKLVLPCRNQTDKWQPHDIERYEKILKKADEVIYTSENYKPGCMHRRNRYLVDHSGICVAYCVRTSGGTAYTLDYARRCGLRIFTIDTQEICDFRQ